MAATAGPRHGTLLLAVVAAAAVMTAQACRTGQPASDISPPTSSIGLPDSGTAAATSARAAAGGDEVTAAAQRGLPGVAPTATQVRVMSAATEEAYGGRAETQAARAAFAADAGVPPDQVTVLSVEPVTWSDSSLGCPEPGKSYLQVLTPGYRIALRTGDVQATYHTDRASPARRPMVVRCGRPSKPGPVAGVGVPDLAAISAPVLDRVRKDLRDRLGSDEPIALVSTSVADVTELDCGVPEEVEAGPGPPKVILEFHLRAGSDVHVYRAWTDEILYCGTAAGTAVE